MNQTNSMKFATIAVFVTALAVLPVAKAQQTQTNCTVNSNTVNCTSNSTPTFQQNMDSFNKSMQVAGNNIAAARQANMNDKVKIEYCHQNPGGSITTGSDCERNPAATITWNDGTASPCSSVLGHQ